MPKLSIMNIFSILGFLIAALVLFIGLYLASDNLEVFLDYRSLFIVLGGTLAATAISFQLDRIFLLVKVFLARMLGGKKVNYSKIIEEIMQVSEAYRKGESLEALAQKASDPFLKESLILFADGVLDADRVYTVLEKRVENMKFHYSEDANRIKTLGKFPPAFGMMGTTIGMIVLLGNLGGADAIKTIGPAMAICLITTLYGVIFANLVVIPVGENLQDSAREIYLKNQIVLEGVKLILDKTNPIILAEELNSFLTPTDRLNWKAAA